ncbi:hypothetical protein [Herpetosiphon giganteus]|uniref:hypothetical protein n=1 Tax=Herpetosiphon giganteus TaxID=2029754 RepID=UPI00195EFB1D|nr:hypothetical protein [Herpetosiphon giganteus]MBM7846500.1 hypothetical protein [Herpetosiphon giganteus]
MQQDIIAQTLHVIQEDRPKSTVVMLVGQLIDDMGEAQLAERLDAVIPQTWPWKVVAELYEILSWWTSDEGAALLRTTEEWLREGTNLRRIQIALFLSTYPFRDSDEMFAVLSGIAQRFPAAAKQRAKTPEEPATPRKSARTFSQATVNRHLATFCAGDPWYASV